MTPYHEALLKNRAELVMLQCGLQRLIDRCEMEIQAAAGEIVMLKKSIAGHGELITQIDLELNQPAGRRSA